MCYAMCEVVKVKIDFHFISPRGRGRKGKQGVRGATGHFCGHGKCFTHCRNLRAMFYEWIFSNWTHNFPSLYVSFGSAFFFSCFLFNGRALVVRWFPQFPMGNLKKKKKNGKSKRNQIKTNPTILTILHVDCWNIWTEKGNREWTINQILSAGKILIKFRPEKYLKLINVAIFFRFFTLKKNDLKF